MQRYSRVSDKIPREIVLLKSYPCLYGKCSFCNYILDNSTRLEEIIAVNQEVLQSISGEFGVLEVLNSGSIFELPALILDSIRQIVNEKNIRILYFEAYYAYRKRLEEMRKFFAGQEIRYRIGIETFDDEFRARVLNKPFSTKNIAKLAQEFYACCLLICIQGQTKDQILTDINLAQRYFGEITINVFIDNGTVVKRDEELVRWFIQDVYPRLKDIPNLEILIDNKDLGVYVQ